MNMTWKRLILLTMSKKRPKNNSEIRARSSLVEGGAGRLLVIGILVPAEFWMFFLDVHPFICVLISTAIFCDTGYFVWIEFGRSILTFPHLLSKFWLLLLTLKQSCIHLIFFSLFKLFLISRPVTFHEEWKHFEISCFSIHKKGWKA